MFYSSFTLDPDPIPASPWLLDHLPQGQLVLLDGPSGVGKSLLAAFLAAELAQLPRYAESAGASPVLWIDNLNRFENLTGRQLQTHRIPADACRILPTESLEFGDIDSDTPQRDVLRRIDEECHSVRPSLLVINDLEQTFPFLLDLHPDNQKAFWKGLQSVAISNECAILVIRATGLHQPRQASRLSRFGDSALLCLTLAWHPHFQNQRILTVAKNNLGPVGHQTLISITSQGRVTVEPLKTTQHLAPGYQSLPKTWTKKKPGPISLAPEILNQLRQLLAEPAPARDIKEFFLAAGYTPGAVRSALELAHIKLIRRGKDWWYILEHSTSHENGPETKNSTIPASQPASPEISTATSLHPPTTQLRNVARPTQGHSGSLKTAGVFTGQTSKLGTPFAPSNTKSVLEPTPCSRF